jgi:hypothetical protein
LVSHFDYGINAGRGVKIRFLHSFSPRPSSNRRRRPHLPHHRSPSSSILFQIPLRGSLPLPWRSSWCCWWLPGGLSTRGFNPFSSRNDFTLDLPMYYVLGRLLARAYSLLSIHVVWMPFAQVPWLDLSGRDHMPRTASDQNFRSHAPEPPVGSGQHVLVALLVRPFAAFPTCLA